jgi:signal-transduction protein with cAMP-binding, CBS, and nucleotidyltransferase domain
MMVKEIMVEKVISINTNKSIQDACEKYRDKKIGCLLVTDDEGDCVGIVTERDIIERTICMHRNPEKTSVSQIMTTEIKTVNPFDRIEKAADIMMHNRIKKLPVIQNGEIVGIITATDLTKILPDFSSKYCQSCQYIR